ncbi:head decoration protein [Ensifer sp. LCM 4579]|uniref:head decoration protein n=1 Tax=Ensifer sp. LCM 4579 TaxID=1848292 RepID=UPI0008DA9653|nr:head decoration protein [Ensifer sp. LCM 4579]OHV85799.1 hypothetical protein LCM4579_00055 [Ensifer sp. LCM 4579]
MTTLIDSGKREGGYIIGELQSETGGMYARERGTLLAGTVGKSGMVVGVVTASGKYTPLTPGATDGSEDAAAILFSSVDASAADAPAVFHVRGCEVNDAELIWPDGISANDKAAAIAALKAKGIIVR